MDDGSRAAGNKAPAHQAIEHKEEQIRSEPANVYQDRQNHRSGPGRLHQAEQIRPAGSTTQGLARLPPLVENIGKGPTGPGCSFKKPTGVFLMPVVSGTGARWAAGDRER